ncbi:MAG: ABC transporter permease [Myxococcaceae bacterium]|nr:ABC transporter permease [Myxococcaceae bacterium]
MRRALPSVLSVLIALLVSFIAAAFTLGDLGQAASAYLAMLQGAVGDWPRYFETGNPSTVLRPIGEAGTKAALLTLTGLSVAVAFRVGLFNIGAQGQMVVGALAAAFIGAQLQLPSPLHVTLALLAAALLGSCWALLATGLKLWRGVHEVISTIMLNWVAVSLVENWLVVGPLKATASGTNSLSGTAQIHATAELPRLVADYSRLNLGFFIAVALAVAVTVWMQRTRAGFESRAVGLAPKAAEAAGVPVARRVLQAMAVSGALAGLAGGTLILGTELKYPATLASPYGFDGIAIALIGQGHPLGALGTALVFGALRAGGTHMQLFGVHKSFPELIQGLALLLVAAKLFWERLVAKKPAAGGVT